MRQLESSTPRPPPRFSFLLPRCLRYDFQYFEAINRYVITADARGHPTAWTLRGSYNNGADTVAVDSQSGINFFADRVALR